MIKKISQLDPLNLALSNGTEDRYEYNVLHELSSAMKDSTLFEASFKNNESDEAVYYTSYQCTLTDLERYTGIDWMRPIVSQLTASKFVISNDFWIGVPSQESEHDGVDNYYPNSDAGLSVFSKTELHNRCTFHGAMDVHGPASFAKVINGVAYRAQWGDLGEYYKTDAMYEAGTILQFGGEAEMTAAKTEANGVVSMNPGIVLNAQEKDAYSVAVALCGKVPVKVVGLVNKFDKIVLSNIPGVGIAKFPGDKIRKTIAVALESSNNVKIKNVLCSTRMSLDG